MSDRQLIIDGDGHFVEPADTWVRYLEREWRDQIYFAADTVGSRAHEQSARPWRLTPGSPETAPRGDLVERFVIDDFETHLTSPAMPFTVSDTMQPRGILPKNQRHLPFDASAPGGFSGDERLKIHDGEGIDAAVLFPTLGLFIGSIRNGALAAAFARAVNRFAADYCSAAPKELYAVATLPAQDPEAAAAELRRCVTEGGFVSGWIRPNPTPEGGRTVDDPALDVLWSTAEELDVPICFHSGTTGREPTAGMDRAKTFLLAHAVAHPFEAMLAFGSLFQSGVFERHRNLRVGFMESNSGWAPFWLDRLDEHCEVMGWMFDPPLRRNATETFIEQCVIGCESEERMVPYVQQRLGEDRVLWASDYPHFDCEMPGLVSPVLERNDLTASQRNGLLNRAAAKFYRLDTLAIRNACAQRRGSWLPAPRGACGVSTT